MEHPPQIFNEPLKYPATGLDGFGLFDRVPIRNSSMVLTIC